MVSIHPHFIVNRQGCKTAVILSIAEWDAVLDELEQLEDIRDYDLKSAGIDDFSRCSFYTVCLKRK